MAKILIVEDDRELAEVIEDAFSKQHSVEIVDDGKEAIDRLKLYSYDLIILDWGLPGSVSGIDVCRTYRKAGGAGTILMLTGRNEIEDKEEGLDSGADDYLTKPFDARELMARVRALLRRPTQVIDNVIKLGALKLDCSSMCLIKDEEQISLLPREFALLEFFMKQPNRYFSAEALLDRIWSSESDTSPDTIRIYITRLRKKIDTDGQPSLIETRRNAGYMLRVDVD